MRSKKQNVEKLTPLAPDGKSVSLFDNLITVEVLAEELGIAPQTLRNWVAKRIIPFVPLGRRTMFLRSSIEAWLKQKERVPCQ